MRKQKSKENNTFIFQKIIVLKKIILSYFFNDTSQKTFI